MKKCKTSKELAEAIKNKEDYIVIEGDLKNKVFRIKAVGPVAWGVCAAALVVAITSYSTMPVATAATAPTGGVGGAVSAVSGVAATTVAAATLGTATTSAIAIGVAAGGIGALTALRDKYKIVEKDDKQIKLKRK